MDSNHQPSVYETVLSKIELTGNIKLTLFIQPMAVGISREDYDVCLWRLSYSVGSGAPSGIRTHEPAAYLALRGINPLLYR